MVTLVGQYLTYPESLQYGHPHITGMETESWSLKWPMGSQEFCQQFYVTTEAVFPTSTQPRIMIRHKSDQGQEAMGTLSSHRTESRVEVSRTEGS